MMQPRHFALKCKEEPSQNYFEFVFIYFDCLNSSLTQSPPRKQITWTKIGDLKEAILFVLNAQSTEYKNGCQATNEEETQNMDLHEVPYFINCHIEKKTVKVKVSFSLEQATKAQRGSRCIALLFLHPRR